MMESRALDGSTCWQCGFTRGAASNISNPRPMEVGDVAICPYCLAISIVDEENGVFVPRPPDTAGPDRDLLENKDLLLLLFTRMLHISGLVARRCPQCKNRVLFAGNTGRAPRFMDNVDCPCGAPLWIQGDYSLGLRGERT